MQQIADNAQQVFLGTDFPGITHLLSVYEELITSWESKQNDPVFAAISSMIREGAKLLGKYYDAMDKSPLSILSTSKYFNYSVYH